MPNRDGEPTQIGCPGCAGVLSTFTEGHDDFIRYACTVGHSFSPLGLIEAKEQQLEHGMWVVISILAHLEMAYHDVFEQCRIGVANVSREAVDGRVQQVRADAQVLRDLIERDRLPALESTEDAAESA